MAVNIRSRRSILCPTRNHTKRDAPITTPARVRGYPSDIRYGIRKTESPSKHPAITEEKSARGTKAVPRVSFASVIIFLELWAIISPPSFGGEGRKKEAIRPVISKASPIARGNRMSYIVRNGNHTMKAMERSDTLALIAEETFLYSDFLPSATRVSLRNEDPVPDINASAPSDERIAPTRKPENECQNKKQKEEPIRKIFVRISVLR